MLEADERRALTRAEPTVGEPDAAGLNELSGCSFKGHGRLLGFDRPHLSQRKTAAVRSRTPPIETRTLGLGLHVRASIGRNDQPGATTLLLQVLTALNKRALLGSREA